MFSKILKISEPWNDQGKRGNPVDSIEVRAYLAHVRVEQRRVGVTVQQACPMLASVLLQLIRYMRRSAGQHRTAKEKVEKSSNIALFVTAFHTAEKRPALIARARRTSLPRADGNIFKFFCGKTLRQSSLAVAVRQDHSCHELCAVCAVQGFALVAKSKGWLPRGGYLFPQVESDGARTPERPRYICR